MKVIVKDNFLNVRRGAPSVNAPVNLYLSPGDTIDVEDSIYKGDKYDGIDAWYKGRDTNNYYWSGGVAGSIANGTVFYNSFLNKFDQEVLSNQGDQTTIIIIDQGIAINPTYFDDSKIHAINYDNDPISTFHGNFIGGIIAGKSSVIGIVPKAEVISLKYISDNTSPAQFLKNLIQALQDCLSNPGPTIINLSQGFSKSVLEGRDNEKANITNLIKKIISQPNKFVICSAGDNLEINDNIFPASMDECISVGCLDSDYMNLNVLGNVKILSPIVNFTSFDIDFKLKEDIGSSFATAVITSIASCIVSSRLPAITKYSDLIIELKKYMVDRSTFQFEKLTNFQYEIT